MAANINNSSIHLLAKYESVRYVTEVESKKPEAISNGPVIVIHWWLIALMLKCLCRPMKLTEINLWRKSSSVIFEFNSKHFMECCCLHIIIGIVHGWLADIDRNCHSIDICGGKAVNITAEFLLLSIDIASHSNWFLNPE